MDHIISVEHKKRKQGELKLHFFIVINPNVEHSVFWFMTHTLDRSEILKTCKDAVREKKDELFIFDGQLYQLDHGDGRFKRQRWENVEYDL